MQVSVNAQPPDFPQVLTLKEVFAHVFQGHETCGAVKFNKLEVNVNFHGAQIDASTTTRQTLCEANQSKQE